MLNGRGDDAGGVPAPTTSGPLRPRPSLPARRLDARLVAVAGSLCIAFSPILIALADVSPGTATFFRCVLALPLLVPLAWWEMRRSGQQQGVGRARTIGRPVILLLGGGMLGIDMTLWAESVHAVGAGVSTVLVNVQVVILPLLAFLVLGERVRRSFVLAVPVMLAAWRWPAGWSGRGTRCRGRTPSAAR